MTIYLVAVGYRESLQGGVVDAEEQGQASCEGDGTRGTDEDEKVYQTLNTGQVR